MYKFVLMMLINKFALFKNIISIKNLHHKEQYLNYTSHSNKKTMYFLFMTFDKCLQFSMILHDYSEYSFIYHSKTKLMLILAINAINNCLSKGNSYSKQGFINRHGKTVS